MSDGLIFDIKELGLHDGSGLRTTVFLKGCPLSCAWCHNPEGQHFSPELTLNKSKCTGCGRCRKSCTHEACAPFARCLRVCPNNCLKIAGERVSPQKLAERLLKNRTFLEKGGVTFSGGEPLAQGEFILETIGRLPGIRTACETCGFVDPALFLRVTQRLDDVFMDIKLIDEQAHLRWTKQSNRLILQNAEALMRTGKTFCVRVPLIPGVTDTHENLGAIAAFLSPARDRVKIELIPYNRLTGAKYESVGKVYKPDFDETATLNKDLTPFASRGLTARAF